MTLLEVKKLRREYTRGGNVFAAVNNAGLTMESGEFVSIIGRSGSGKTTFISMIAGLVSPTSGEIFLDGKNLAEQADEAASLIRNRVLGYIPQGSSLLPNLTAVDNVRLPFYLAPRPAKELKEGCTGRAFELLEAAGVAHLAEVYPPAMSGGELRRVAIARALINRPKLLIADEPTSDLDVETTDEIMRLLLGLNKQGIALLMVTHDLEIKKYAERTLTMADGCLEL